MSSQRPRTELAVLGSLAQAPMTDCGGRANWTEERSQQRATGPGESVTPAAERGADARG